MNYTRAVLAGEAEFQASVEDIIANNMSTAKTILLTTVTPGENLASVHFVELALVSCLSTAMSVSPLILSSNDDVLSFCLGILVQVLVGCSLIAVVLTMVTFLFIKLTSGLTLSIVNIAKQLVRSSIDAGVHRCSNTVSV